LLNAILREMKSRGIEDPDLKSFNGKGYLEFLNSQYPAYTTGKLSVWVSRVKEALTYRKMAKERVKVETLRLTYERPLKKAMKDRHETMRSTAAILGCDHSALSRQMKGQRRWPTGHLLKLQEHFNIKFEGLPADVMAYHDSLPYVRQKPAAQDPIIIKSAYVACGGEVSPVKFTQEQKTEAPAMMSDDELLELLVIRYLRERPGLVDAVFPKTGLLRELKTLVDKINE
jgi:hypothetical protein